MSVMSVDERSAFLAELHVGVIVIDGEDGQRPLAVPIWYDYTPDVGLWVITVRSSRKGAAIEQAGRYTIVVQEEAVPYRYISVEGPVTENRPSDIDGDLRPMARRYLGEQMGDKYVAQMAGAASSDDRVYVMQPERWLSSDHTEMFAALER